MLVHPNTHESAAALRRRLLSPANAKPDAGIDLKRARGCKGAPVALMPFVAPKPPPVAPQLEPEAVAVPAGPATWLEGLTDFNEALRQITGVSKGEGHIRLATIRMIVAHRYYVTLEDMDGPSRHRPYCRPRFIALYLCSKMTGASFSLLGRVFGGRDHTTILQAIRRVETWIAESTVFAAEVKGLDAKIREVTG